MKKKGLAKGIESFSNYKRAKNYSIRQGFRFKSQLTLKKLYLALTSLQDIKPTYLRLKLFGRLPVKTSKECLSGAIQTHICMF